MSDLSRVPELADLGRVLHSSSALELTESETEYVVLCTKHILEECVVLEFTITNTVADQLLVEACTVMRTRLYERFLQALIWKAMMASMPLKLRSMLRHLKLHVVSTSVKA